MPKIHLGRRTDSIHQVDIDIDGPFATRWAQVGLGGFFRAPTWWSLPGQKKLSNVPSVYIKLLIALKTYEFSTSLWSCPATNANISKTRTSKLVMHLFLSLLLPLHLVLISASEHNTSLTLLNRRDNGCIFSPIVAPNSGLHSCGTPGWGVVADCTCCGTVNACLDIVQTCVQADGVYACYNNDVYPAPSPATTDIPAASRTDSSAVFTESHAQSSSNTATALRASTVTAAAASPTSSKGPSLGSVGKSAASMGLQRADIVRVVFVAGLLLAFSHVF